MSIFASSKVKLSVVSAGAEVQRFLASSPTGVIWVSVILLPLIITIAVIIIFIMFVITSIMIMIIVVVVVIIIIITIGITLLIASSLPLPPPPPFSSSTSCGFIVVATMHLYIPVEMCFAAFDIVCLLLL